MGGAGRIGAHENWVDHLARIVADVVSGAVVRRQDRERPVEQLEVMSGVVGAGIARPQHRRERLRGRVAPHPEGMEPEAVLVGGSGVLLVGGHVEERGVEVEHQVSRRRSLPDHLASRRHGFRDLAQLERARRLDRAPGRRYRRHRPEQLVLLSKHGEVGEAVRTIGDGDRQVGEHDARVVSVPGDAAFAHRLRHRPGEAAAIRQLGEQGGAGVRDEVLPVGGHFHAPYRSTTVHLQGALLLGGCLVFVD